MPPILPRWLPGRKWISVMARLGPVDLETLDALITAGNGQAQLASLTACHPRWSHL